MCILSHVTGKQPTVLIALPLAYQNGRDYYSGILQYLARTGTQWNVRLDRDGISREMLERECRRRPADMPDGAILAVGSPEREKNTSRAIRALGAPVVALDATSEKTYASLERVAFVDIDSESIGKRGAEYLSAQGNYASFGVIGYERDCNWSERRTKSFTATVESKSRNCAVLRVPRTGVRDESNVRTMREWAAKLHRPAAVMVACDELARVFLNALATSGMHVPQDVAVLGVDNEWILCTHMRPTLSSVQPDFERSGFLAAQCLERLMKCRVPKTMRVTSPVKSIVGRESTAPSSATGQMILKAENFMRDHATESIRVNDVARYLKVSRRLLDLRFREVTGRTVLNAIHSFQLENVRHLLRTTALSITEISSLCSFRSENHLKRLFKATYGITMSDDRRHSE